MLQYELPFSVLRFAAFHASNSQEGVSIRKCGTRFVRNSHSTRFENTLDNSSVIRTESVRNLNNSIRPIRHANERQRRPASTRRYVLRDGTPVDSTTFAYGARRSRTPRSALTGSKYRIEEEAEAADAGHRQKPTSADYIALTWCAE